MWYHVVLAVLAALLLIACSTVDASELVCLTEAEIEATVVARGGKATKTPIQARFTSVRAVEHGFEADWAPTDNASHYQIAYRVPPHDWDFEWTQNLSYAAHGLARGEEYHIFLRAYNSEGTGPWSSMATAVPTGRQPLLRPTVVPTPRPILTATPTPQPLPTATPTRVIVLPTLTPTPVQQSIWPTSTPTPTPFPATHPSGYTHVSGWLPIIWAETRNRALLISWKPGWGASYHQPEHEVQWRDFSLPDRAENWYSEVKPYSQKSIWIGDLINERTYVVRVRAFKDNRSSAWATVVHRPSAHPTPTPMPNERLSCITNTNRFAAAQHLRLFGERKRLVEKKGNPTSTGEGSEAVVEIEATFLNPRSDSGASTWSYGFKVREWDDGKYALRFIVHNDRRWTFELIGDTNQVLDSGTLPEIAYDDRLSDPVASKRRYDNGDLCSWPSQYRNYLTVTSKGNDKFQFFVNDFEVRLALSEEELKLLDRTVFEKPRRYERYGLWDYTACQGGYCFVQRPGSNSRFGGGFQD